MFCHNSTSECRLKCTHINVNTEYCECGLHQYCKETPEGNICKCPRWFFMAIFNNSKNIAIKLFFWILDNVMRFVDAESLRTQLIHQMKNQESKELQKFQTQNFQLKPWRRKPEIRKEDMWLNEVRGEKLSKMLFLLMLQQLPKKLPKVQPLTILTFHELVS